MLNLTPVSGSFPFQPKYIPLTSGAKVVLGSDVQDTASSSARTATALNGWFASKPPPRINGVNGDHAPRAYFFPPPQLFPFRNMAGGTKGELKVFYTYIN